MSVFQSKPRGYVPVCIPSEEARSGLEVPGNSAQEKSLAGLQSHWVLSFERSFQSGAKRSQIYEGVLQGLILIKDILESSFTK